MKCPAGLAMLLLTSAALAQSKPLEMTSIQPVKVERREDGIFFIDFGRDAFAQFKAKFDEAGSGKISVSLGEKLSDPAHIDSKPGGSIRCLHTVINDGAATLTRPDARRMPAGVGAVMPFRYVELKGLPAGMTAEKVAAAVTQIAVNYPFDDNAADFSCSNSQLNDVWNLCKYSIKATSYAGIFVDGDRERKPYEADAYINGLGWYDCAGDYTLPSLTDLYLIDHPTWPTEWSMFSVLCAWNDYLHTGDRATLERIYPELKIKSLRALERGDGLIITQSVPPTLLASLHLGKEQLKDIVDWPKSERDSYEMQPVNTVVNAFHCRSLMLLSKMAAALGKRTDAAELQLAFDRSLSSLNQKLFDSQTGLYVDGEGSNHSSQHANMFPLAFDLVPADRRARVIDFIVHRQMACSVYGAQFLMDGLFDNKAGNEAIDLMLAPGDRSWRHMVEDIGTTITLEAWDQKYKPNQDWNHAWGAAPANLIPAKVLGVEPIEAGYSKALIWPRVAGKSGRITWTRGRVPTSQGPISVDWKASDDSFSLIIELPAAVTAQVRLPTDWGRQVILDDHPAIVADTDGCIVVEVRPGKHVFAVRTSNK